MVVRWWVLECAVGFLGPGRVGDGPSVRREGIKDEVCDELVAVAGVAVIKDPSRTEIASVEKRRQRS